MLETNQHSPTMKKFFCIVMSAIFIASIAAVSANASSERKKTRREQNAELRKEFDDKASKTARKQAKAKEKQGWMPIGGSRPIEAQLERVWKYQLEDEDGETQYIVESGTATGNTMSAAQAAADIAARNKIASRMETDLGIMEEGELNNSAHSDDDVQSSDNMRQVYQSFVKRKLKKTFTLAEWYRKTENGKYQVEVTMALKSSTLKEEFQEEWLRYTKVRNDDMHKKLSEKLDESGSE